MRVKVAQRCRACNACGSDCSGAALFTWSGSSSLEITRRLAQPLLHALRQRVVVIADCNELILLHLCYIRRCEENAPQILQHLVLHQSAEHENREMRRACGLREKKSNGLRDRTANGS